MQTTVEPAKDEWISSKIKVSFVLQGRRAYFEDDKEERNCYAVTVSYKGNNAKFTYGDSLADSDAGLKPKKRDILEIITSDFFYTKDYYPSYDDFAQEFGYDEDSRKGYRIYERCLEQGDKLHSVFSESDIRKLSEEINNA